MGLQVSLSGVFPGHRGLAGAGPDIITSQFIASPALYRQREAASPFFQRSPTIRQPKCCDKCRFCLQTASLALVFVILDLATAWASEAPPAWPGEKRTPPSYSLILPYTPSYSLDKGWTGLFLIPLYFGIEGALRKESFTELKCH